MFYFEKNNWKGCRKRVLSRGSILMGFPLFWESEGPGVCWWMCNFNG
jgi:hypothetical protein